MQTAFADHLDIARACESIGEIDLGEGIAAMGASLGLLAQELWIADLTAQEKCAHGRTNHVNHSGAFRK
ncbi:hypothetical protein SynMINOS11_02130 [Synechococcus sp. Minos11]|uniref:hypothetical protein n=1 Tax=Synechococcus sp. Minos11 TaxID=221341 RepID=UPI00164669F6|nr:hypothetical protein [Synechococcus sp. Minos11]QNJ09582.1 hypothetical protein SynMINOS11_02130 [Synechococcus sp. Minos11]